MNLTFEEIKKGRKVTAIRFKFKKTIVFDRINHKTGFAKKHYIKPEQIKKKINNSKYPDTVLEGQLSFEEKQQKQGKIGNVASNLLQNLQVN